MLLDVQYFHMFQCKFSIMHIIIETWNLLQIRFNPSNTKPHLMMLTKLILMYSVIIWEPPEYNSDT